MQPPPPVLTGQGPVLATVSAGGALGSLARWGTGLALPTPAGGIPWTILWINVVGCLLIGVLIAVVQLRHPHPLVRPFLGTGVLGGFTTFSAYAVDGAVLLRDGRVGAAAAYLAGTLAAALAAAWIGLALTRRALAARS